MRFEDWQKFVSNLGAGGHFAKFAQTRHPENEELTQISLKSVVPTFRPTGLKSDCRECFLEAAPNADNGRV